MWNENKLDEMAKILDEYHKKYVPTKPCVEDLTLEDGTTRVVDKTEFHKLLMGGDQLTVARVRGTIALRTTHDTPVERLGGVTPVVEDWHARLTLMKVSVAPSGNLNVGLLHHACAYAWTVQPH